MVIRQDYQQELESLSNEFIRMGALAIAAVDKAFTSVDTGDRELATEVMEGDDAINILEKNLEAQCMQLLLRQQPVGKDLRRIVGVLKMASEIERVGDCAADIAELGMQLPGHLTGRLQDMKRMAAAAREMVSDVIRAYVGESMVLADYIIRRDDIVNNYYDSLYTEISMYMGDEKATPDTAMAYLLIIQYIERIGDHAVSIAEWIKFYKTGTHQNRRIL